ncbi:hypothetical protein GQ457_13G023790 [Hibiscus cannabinus]
MAETGRNVPPPAQATTTETTEPQQNSLEERVAALESATTENNGYLQRILSLLSKGTEEVELSTPGSSQQPPAINQSVTEGKKPLHIRVIDEHERYVFNPEEPGVLANKPSHISLNIKNPEQQIKTKGMEYEMEERHQSNSPNTFIPRPKIELQTFDGENPRGWVRRCQKYFSIFAIPEFQKMEIASMYLVGKAETWFDGYIMQKNKATWHEFTTDLCHRFCNKNFNDIIEDFNKLVQKGTVEEYQEKFELQPYMLQHNASLGEDYFISTFVSGLKEKLRHKNKKLKYSSKSPYQPQPLLQKTSHSSTSQKPVVTLPPNKQTLLDYRRSHNLCFKYGNKFTPGHQCKTKQLNLMEEDIGSGKEENSEEEMQEMGEMQQDEELEISINALTGSSGYNTLRLQGLVKGKTLNVLVDSGSTHSFVNPRWAKEGVEVMQTPPLTITVANGEKLYSTAMSKLLSWKMQGHSFEHDFRVLQMGGRDMVLGVDWMKKYNPVTMDFNEMTLKFSKEKQ